MLLVGSKLFAKESKIRYTKENISSYFSGIVSVNQNYNDEAFKHLKKVKLLKNRHSRFNVEYIRTLILIEKYEYNEESSP